MVPHFSNSHVSSLAKDRARDQVLLRVRSTCSASAATMGDPDCPLDETPIFLHIVGPHRTPWLIRMAGGAITASWGDRRQSAWSAIARLVQYPETLRGFARSSELVLGFRAS
jgi:hypothetical protein